MQHSDRKFAQSSIRRRVGDYFRRRNPRYMAGAVFAALCVLLLLMPSAFVTEGPGPTRNVLGTVDTADGRQEMIEITGARSYESTGRLLLTTVNSYGIDIPALNIEILAAWFDPDAGVLPREAVVPPDQSVEDYERESRKDMVAAQDSASEQALAFLASQGMDTSNVKISMHIDEIGGPSAGLMYTLGVIDKLTPQDETGGLTIAGTGTMESDGTVGPIGGIRFKLQGAREAGATWFLAPADNCDEVVGHVPDGLHVVRVATLQDAYDALSAIGEGDGGSLPQCAVD